MLRSLSGLPVALCCVSSLWAADNETPLGVAQKLFDAMKAHDAAAATRLFVPGASLASVDPEGKASVTPFEKFAEHIGTSKSDWLEHMSNPKVLAHGSIAAVWGEYDFYLNGALHHCGIDSFSMLRTATGWKIASVSDTRETSGCMQHGLKSPAPQ
ncbi:MAG: nuclear transport factor 2 family protein [Acidobacteriota bacterium]|nr:nuclear transport factor 2 family protein [Acidobacteriota bacterium]